MISPVTKNADQRMGLLAAVCLQTTQQFQLLIDPLAESSPSSGREAVPEGQQQLGGALEADFATQQGAHDPLTLWPENVARCGCQQSPVGPRCPFLTASFLSRISIVASAGSSPVKVKW